MQLYLCGCVHIVYIVGVVCVTVFHLCMYVYFCTYVYFCGLVCVCMYISVRMYISVD